MDRRALIAVLTLAGCVLDLPAEPGGDGSGAGASGSGGSGAAGSGPGGGSDCDAPAVPACADRSAQPLAVAVPGAVDALWLTAHDGRFALAYTRPGGAGAMLVFDRAGNLTSPLLEHTSGLRENAEPIAMGPSTILLATDDTLRRFDHCGTELLRLPGLGLLVPGVVSLHRADGGYYMLTLSGGARDLGVALFADDATSAPSSFEFIGKVNCCAQREWGASVDQGALHAAHWDGTVPETRALIYPAASTPIGSDAEPRWAGVIGGERVVVAGDEVLVLNAAGSVARTFALEPFDVDEFGIGSCFFAAGPNLLYRSCARAWPVSVIGIQADSETPLIVAPTQAGIAWDGEGLGAAWITGDEKLIFQYSCGEPQ